MPGGEKCPRCHYNEGYPVSFGEAIHKGQKMRFSCRRCGHKWVKRNSFSVTGWFVYGIGGIIGIIIGIYQLVKTGFLGELLRAIPDLFMGLWDIIVKSVSGFF